MNYLAIDTSGKNLTVVINKDGEIHSYFDAECGVSHSVSLMNEIERLIERSKFDLKGADFFAVVVGAGSFTGIRIGVSTVKAMCFAYNKPCLSITSFDTLAYNEDGGKVLALIDAKHDGYYACGYNDGAIELSPCYIMKDKVLELLDEYEGVASEGCEGLSVKKVSVLDGLVKAIEKNRDSVTDDLDSIIPLYVRKSQAEEGR